MPHTYPHMCRDGHPEIGHSDNKDDELCPLCRALNLLQRVEDEAGDNGYITTATHGAIRDMLYTEERMQR